MSYLHPPRVPGLMRSVDASTSTGPGTSFSVSPATRVAMQVVRPTTAAVATSVTVQGSMDGTNWVNLGAAQTFQTIGSSIYVSTGVYLVAAVRANVNAHTAVGPITVNLLTG